MSVTQAQSNPQQNPVRAARTASVLAWLQAIQCAGRVYVDGAALYGLRGRGLGRADVDAALVELVEAGHVEVSGSSHGLVVRLVAKTGAEL